MPRTDLLALTEDGLIQLANAGLVKRARRDLAAGPAPALTEAADGALEARFADGTVTRLPPGRLPGDARCSCPASGLCRHKLLLVLAYQEQARQPAAGGWNPAAFDRAGFESNLNARARAELAALLQSRLRVHLEAGAVPVARLPMATVRFLVPGDLAYARCDCAARSGCAHIALALHAFQAAPAGTSEVTIGAAPPGPACDTELAAAVDAVLSRLLTEGVVAGSAAHGRPLAEARDRAAAAGATWAVLAVEELAGQISAYDQRSARYDDGGVLALVAELYARTRADDAASALGLGEAMETVLDKTRLISLGARATTEPEGVSLRLLWVDADTGTVLMTAKQFTAAPEQQPALITCLGEQPLTPGVTVSAAAHGQVVAAAARRRADGLLTLAGARRDRIAVAPRPPTPPLRPPVRVEALAALTLALERAPPALIQPRHFGAAVHSFEIETVLDQAWSPSEQLWCAAVTLRAGGGTLVLERSYDAAAPLALTTLTAASAGRFGPIREVAGPVYRRNGAVICDPWLLVTGYATSKKNGWKGERVIVPDLFPGNGGAAGDPADGHGGVENMTIMPRALPQTQVRRPASPPDQAWRLLAGLLHGGRRCRDASALKHHQETTSVLRQAGFATTASQMTAVLAAAPDDPVPIARAAAWIWTIREGLAVAGPDARG